MKARRKLIPAIVLLLVSVLMLSTASYAWFANTTEVTASGMSITAQAPTNLRIKSGDKGSVIDDYAATASISSPRTSIKLSNITNAAALNGGKIDWSAYVGTDSANGTANGDPTISQTGDFETSEKSGDITYFYTDKQPTGEKMKTYYYAKTTLNLVLDTNGSTETLTDYKIALSKIVASVDGEGDLPAFYRSAKVLVVNGDKLFEYKMDVNPVDRTLTLEKTTFTDADVVIDNVSTNPADPSQLELYFFFDGNSQYCTTNNVTAATNGLNFSLTFSKVTVAD